MYSRYGALPILHFAVADGVAESRDGGARGQPAKQTVKQKTKATAPKPKPQDPLIGRQVQTWYDLPSGKEAQVRGTIMGVKTRKTGKKKGKTYDVSYEARYGLPNGWIHVSEIQSILV